MHAFVYVQIVPSCPDMLPTQSLGMHICTNFPPKRPQCSIPMNARLPKTRNYHSLTQSGSNVLLMYGPSSSYPNFA